MDIAPLNPIITSAGFDHFGWCELSRPLSFDVYQAWVEQGHHGEMSYLKDHMPLKENPRETFPKMRSVLVIAQNYYPAKVRYETPLSSLRIAKYAQNKDYHFWFKEKLRGLIEELKRVHPQDEFLAFTDSAPILERDYAAQAGLGWVGKNSCVIHPKKGSLFFIGEVMTTLVLSQAAVPFADFCGKCQRCIEVCPTQAILPNRTLDARKCISYLTIESKTSAAKDLREQIGDWFFGCDLCQTVCPWNQKVFGSEIHETSVSSRENQVKDLRWILKSSNQGLLKTLRESPITRAGAKGLKRNALYLVANLQLTELIPEVKDLTDHPDLGPLARETLAVLKP